MEGKSKIKGLKEVQRKWTQKVQEKKEKQKKIESKDCHDLQKKNLWRRKKDKKQ